MKKPICTALLFGVLFAAYGQTYYTGTGGRGMSIAVGRPDGKNLPKEEQYFLKLGAGHAYRRFSKVQRDYDDGPAKSGQDS
jgi:hypothetical protein